VATIQIRDIPDDVHEELQRQAKAAGQSLQAFMRQRIVESARSRARWADAVAEWEAALAADPPRIARQQILDGLDDDRRR
jgi:plasmid stability protein